MSPITYILALVMIAGQFAVPRRFAFAPLLVAACTIPDMVVIDVGIALTVTKLIILAGLIRAAGSGALSWSSRNPLDVLFAAWACWAILSGFAHDPKDYNPITVRGSMVYDLLGTYLYARAYLTDEESILRLSKLITICMLFLASMMVVEKTTSLNIPWTLMTGTPAHAETREGRIRAAGPFKHPILAGTVGASSIALLLPLWRRNRLFVAAGVSACLAIVFCSASSGPFMTLIMVAAALTLWPFRQRLKLIKTTVVLIVVALAFVMKAPIWYLIARIDVAGGSTGWHRAELITQAIQHFDRWWAFGTDYTRDWIAYGIGWTSEMVDITNLYIQMGIKGGLLLMLLFIAILLKSFRLLGNKMTTLRSMGEPGEFLFWCFGSALFAHCVTFFSVTYFDQSYIFFCILIGAVSAICVESTQWPVISEDEVASDVPSTTRLLVALKYFR